MFLETVSLPEQPAFRGFSQSIPSNPLIDKLTRYCSLRRDDLAALTNLCRNRRMLPANETLVHEGSRMRVVSLILTGVACRYKYLSDGKRQIFGFLLPGDLCDAEFLVSSHCDHNVSLLNDAEVALIPMADLAAVIGKFPRIARAFMRATAVDGAMLREWLLNVGQRSALERIAHLFCELAARLNGLDEHSARSSLSIPLTQVQVADSVGLTVVHVNRCLKRLQADGLIALNRRCVTIMDLQRLRRVAGFDEAYLKMEQQPATADRWMLA